MRALFSVQSLCSLCLCGVFLLGIINHRDTENTEIAQRNQCVETFCGAGIANVFINLIFPFFIRTSAMSAKERRMRIGGLSSFWRTSSALCLRAIRNPTHYDDNTPDYSASWCRIKSQDYENQDTLVIALAFGLLGGTMSEA